MVEALDEAGLHDLAVRHAERGLGLAHSPGPPRSSSGSSTTPWDWVGVLLSAGRDEEAWTFAVAHPDAAGGQWETLCARRARTSPAETVPHYERLVTETLATTGRASYATASRLLARLRAVCTAAGTPGAFAEFMAATAEANRRRPACIDELVRAGLIRRDGRVVDA